MSHTPEVIFGWGHGDDVRRIQRALGVTADGIFGPVTRQAVVDFQRSNGLGVDGIVGPQTWNRLF
ncbi:peptidoglycan-binding domain-containing protein [Terribacillus sp. FSL K6-0262]|uniref:peptidoglycan-binding domain-containing protein n=1 Tax=Terribacillus TaxID=459532 RepID=UPI0030EE8DD6